MSNNTLQQKLADAGYDLIDGPIRNHKPLQLWLKQGFDPAELYYENILHAFRSKVKLSLEKDPSLVVEDSIQSNYSFNIGLTLIKEIFQSLGLPPVDLDTAFQSGKKISISYKNAYSEAIPIGQLIRFFQEADFLHPNPILLRHANRNRLLVVTGIVSAEQLIVEWDADTKLNSKQVLALNKSMQNKAEFSLTRNKKARMTAGIGRMPIAVKAGRIDFDKGQFSNIDLISDSRDLF